MLFSGDLECFYFICPTYTYKYKKTLGHFISRPRYFRQAKKKNQKTKQKQYTVQSLSKTQAIQCHADTIL